MICQFALKKNGEIKCMCNNIAHGLIDGKPVNTASAECIENPECYYKLWRRALKELEELKSNNENS